MSAFWSVIVDSQANTHNRLTAFVWDNPGELVPEGKNNLDFTEARDSE